MPTRSCQKEGDTVETAGSDKPTAVHLPQRPDEGIEVNPPKDEVQSRDRDRYTEQANKDNPFVRSQWIHVRGLFVQWSKCKVQSCWGNALAPVKIELIQKRKRCLSTL